MNRTTKPVFPQCLCPASRLKKNPHLFGVLKHSLRNYILSDVTKDTPTLVATS